MSAPCMKCGAETEHRVRFTGLLEGEVFMCLPCFEPANAEFQESRRQFQELLEAGVSREEANRIMIDRIEGAEPS